jgi:hypothetical protein
MSVNRRQPHVLVLPEDDANVQLANGFHLDPYLSAWKLQLLDAAGGWIKVLDRFVSYHVVEMDLIPADIWSG